MHAPVVSESCWSILTCECLGAKKEKVAIDGLFIFGSKVAILVVWIATSFRYVVNDDIDPVVRSAKVVDPDTVIYSNVSR